MHHRDEMCGHIKDDGDGVVGMCIRKRHEPKYRDDSDRRPGVEVERIVELGDHYYVRKYDTED